MIDTIAATIVPQQRLPIDLFEAGEVTEAFGPFAKPMRTKFWLNPKGLGPRLTYWRYEDERDTGLLKVEFSVPRLSMDEATQDWNGGAFNVAAACNLVNVYLQQRISADLPSVHEWMVQRIDYCFNWRTDRLAEYMQVLSTLSLRGADRYVYASGVNWRTTARTVKFYQREPDVLRFEVSNFRDACRYMADTWFACVRTVEQLASLPRSLYCMAVALDSLSLRPGAALTSPDLLELRLRDAFGSRNVGIAKHVLHCISTYGPASTREPLSLVGRGVYYAWRKQLIDAEFLLSSGELHTQQLAPLALPFSHVSDDRFVHAQPPQNLEKIFDAGDISASKNFRDLAKELKINAGLPPVLMIEPALISELPGALVLNGGTTQDGGGQP